MKTNHLLLLTLSLAVGLVNDPLGAQDAKPDNPPVVPVPAPTTPTAAPATAQNIPPAAPVNGEKGLRLNFRGVPLDMVLSYLSDAAGFIIVLDTEVTGKLDVWSSQPLSKQEAVDLLNTVLNKNGYAAIRNGRTLRIVSRDDARTKDIPVKSGSDPEIIPKSDEMLTQVIP